MDIKISELKRKKISFLFKESKDTEIGMVIGLLIENQYISTFFGESNRESRWYLDDDDGVTLGIDALPERWLDFANVIIKLFLWPLSPYNERYIPGSIQLVNQIYQILDMDIVIHKKD